ncbi:MAG: ISNCY family transposase [Sphingobacterium sp.]|jgi:hypothetical protein|nr:ISNCY family transposase [Sphingobacterium sp.]
MGRGLLQTHLDAFNKVGARITDERRAGYDKQYEYADAIKGAYGIFFFQHPSMLEYQERLKKKKERCNAETILKVNKIPSANHLTRLLDNVKPSDFKDVFNEGLKAAAKYGALDKYQVLGKYHLVALDGVWFYQSTTINCIHCLHHKTKDGETLYYHDMVAAVLVKGKEGTVLPLNPEFIHNEDGSQKQDCERNAAKRWLESNSDSYKWLNPILLGDDLYSDYPTCTQVLEKGLHFLFTCKGESHKWLYDSIDDECMKVKTVKTWTGRHHLEYRYRWYNGLEIRQEQPTLLVNYLLLEIWNEEKQKVTYRNSWVTDLEIDEKNVVEMAESARARWKIENEHNNVLKHHGYHLDHNFGHGKENACEIYVILNLLAFQMHGVMLLLDEGYQKARKSIRRRDEFFAGLRIIINRYLFETWEEFIGFISQEDEPDG